MIIRRSSEGYNVLLYRNSSPGATRTRTYSDGTVEEISYPTSKNYFIVTDGSVVKKTDSLKTAEDTYTDECAKKGYTPHGRAVIGEHVMLGHVITIQSEFPTESNTKTEIKAFMDRRSIVVSEINMISINLLYHWLPYFQSRMFQSVGFQEF